MNKKFLALSLTFLLAACAPAGGGSLSLVDTSPPVGSASPTASGSPSASQMPLPTSGSNEWGPFAQVGLQNRPDPDPVLTPGVINPDVTQANIHATICVSGYTATIRPPVSYTTPLKIQQIAEYGYTDTNTAHYEEDHLIPLEDGGNPTDPKNLWPEPLTATLSDGTSVGFHVKDRFENRIRAEICNGSITLLQGQAQISQDWVAAWIAAGKP